MRSVTALTGCSTRVSGGIGPVEPCPCLAFGGAIWAFTVTSPAPASPTAVRRVPLADRDEYRSTARRDHAIAFDGRLDGDAIWRDLDRSADQPEGTIGRRWAPESNGQVGGDRRGRIGRPTGSHQRRDRGPVG